MTQSYPGQIPAGMLRIHQGNQEHYVWPVHLPGWLLLGWRVAGSANAPAAPADVPLPQAETALAAVLEPTSQATAIETEPEATTGRGKRGRRRKEEEQPTAAVETTPTETRTAAEQAKTDAEPPAASEWTSERSSSESALDPAIEPAVEPTTEPAAAAPAAEGEVALSALPDDLFDDPLI